MAVGNGIPESVRLRQLNHDFKEVLARYPRERVRTARAGGAPTRWTGWRTTLDRQFPRLRARNLKGKHVEFLVADWKRRELSMGTMANYMSHLRWFAKAIGKPNIVRRSNASYGISEGTRGEEQGPRPASGEAGQGEGRACAPGA